MGEEKSVIGCGDWDCIVGIGGGADVYGFAEIHGAKSGCKFWKLPAKYDNLRVGWLAGKFPERKRGPAPRVDGKQSDHDVSGTGICR